MKIAYIAHPIKGDQTLNIELIKHIVGHINKNRTDVVPFASYLVDCMVLDDRIATERWRGMENNRELFKRKFIDELWLYGAKFSEGMQEEVDMAVSLGIPVVVKDSRIISAVENYILKQGHANFTWRVELDLPGHEYDIIFTQQDNTTQERAITAHNREHAARIASGIAATEGMLDWRFAADDLMGTL